MDHGNSMSNNDVAWGDYKNMDPVLLSFDIQNKLEKMDEDDYLSTALNFFHDPHLRRFLVKPYNKRKIRQLLKGLFSKLHKAQADELLRKSQRMTQIHEFINRVTVFEDSTVAPVDPEDAKIQTRRILIKMISLYKLDLFLFPNTQKSSKNTADQQLMYCILYWLEHGRVNIQLMNALKARIRIPLYEIFENIQ